MDDRNHGAKFPGVEQILEQEIYDRRIFSSLVSKDALDERYGNAPGRRTEDGEYAVVYRLLLGRDADGVSSLVISEGLAEKMSLDEEGLHEAAVRNTPELFPPKVEKMADVMREFETEWDSEIGEGVQEGMLDAPEVQDVYVVSNETRSLGAGAVYYEDKKILQDLSESLQSDLIVLPSSIHEMLVMPDDGQREISELEKVTGGVNSSLLMPQEVLGWKALRYDRNKNELSVAKAQDSPGREQDKQQKREMHHDHRMRRGGR